MNLSDSLTLNSFKRVYELKENALPQCAYLQNGRVGDMNALAPPGKTGLTSSQII